MGGAPHLFGRLSSPQGMATRGVKPTPRGRPSGIPFLAHFTDVAAEAGLQAPTIFGGVTRKDYIVETTGCGCAFFDYDNDGWLDILLLCGTRFGQTPEGATNRLYKNNRDGTFSDLTAKAGLLRTGWACGVCIGDYDNDGFEDLFITYWGENVLYHNNGNGTFTDVTQKAGVAHNRTSWGAGCTWIDYDRNGFLDLFVSNYLDFGLPGDRKAREGENCTFKNVHVNCGPRGLPTGLHSLYRNNGNGTFTDVTDASGIGHAKQRYGLTAVAADFDEDGWPDIFVACDSSPSLLFMNNHDGTFREEGVDRGAALSDDGNEQAGMGVGIGDYNLDGHLDLFKGHFTDDTNTLYRNDGKGNFDDVTLAAGLGVETRYTGWGDGIVDLDNDGYPDLFLVTGNVYPELDGKVAGYPYKTPRLVFRNLGNGRFEEIMEGAGPGIEAAHSSRGCAFGDFDNDGDLDILVINLNEPPSLLRNDLRGENHWLKLKLIGTESNRSAIGARVLVQYGGKQQVQEVISQSSFCSCNDRRLHFGLGNTTAADVEIRWPKGTIQNFAKVAANQLVIVREGQAKYERATWPGR
ncbi:MAG: CRTAC1 family protein [Acidobacteriaceae bacterium]|nr:CRTAC1 family protein [Acidobacteriaceae bacterium]MBV9294302.1 CRTAC1 family protein [Acidobacteriaceae bacterium]